MPSCDAEEGKSVPASYDQLESVSLSVCESVLVAESDWPPDSVSLSYDWSP